MAGRLTAFSYAGFVLFGDPIAVFQKEVGGSITESANARHSKSIALVVSWMGLPGVSAILDWHRALNHDHTSDEDYRNVHGKS
ncbi:MAG: hypothetical protein WBE72_00750 [Terracidiphilus sp.]